MPDNKAKVSKAIREQLVDFTQLFIKNSGARVTYKHSLSGDYDMWRLARYIFSDILSFDISDQPMEKINWSIYFAYKNKYNCSIAHEKFGFRIYVSAGTENEAKEVAESLEILLYKVLLTALPLVEQYARESLLSGEVIVQNAFRELFNPYDYFQKITLRKKKIAEKSRPKIKKVGNITTITSNKAIYEIKYYETASYFSFFSMLEHICVLFLAFRDIPERKSVEKFSNLKWSDKFKKVFDLNEPEFKNIYDKLIGLAKYKRNPSAHGGTYTVFDFYLEGARHKISCTLNDKSVSIQWNNQEDNFSVMKSFLKLISIHPSTQSIFAYITAGFNVSFSNERNTDNDAISRMSIQEINEYIEYTTRRYDDMANMDW